MRLDNTTLATFVTSVGDAWAGNSLTFDVATSGSHTPKGMPCQNRGLHQGYAWNFSAEAADVGAEGGDFCGPASKPSRTPSASVDSLGLQTNRTPGRYMLLNKPA